MPPKILGHKNVKFLTTFCDFYTRHRIALEQNVALTNENASVNLQYVPYKLTYISWPLSQKGEICLLIVTPFGGYYFATIIVATCLVYM